MAYTDFITPNKPFGLPALDWQYAAASNASPIINTTAVTLVAANTALKNYCTGLQLTNTSATATEVVIRDGASVVLWRGWASASMNNLSIINFETPLQTSAVNSAITFAAVTTGASIYVAAQGYAGT
jgi:hypothetical protein